MEHHVSYTENNLSQAIIFTFTYMDVQETFMRASLMVEALINSVQPNTPNTTIPILAYAIERHRADVHKTREKGKIGNKTSDKLRKETHKSMQAALAGITQKKTRQSC